LSRLLCDKCYAGFLAHEDAVSLTANQHMHFLQVAADSTSFSYRFGYQIGSWLPFILIALLVFAILRKQKR
jgi:hypothetical protein